MGLNHLRFAGGNEFKFRVNVASMRIQSPSKTHYHVECKLYVWWHNEFIQCHKQCIIAWYPVSLQLISFTLPITCIQVSLMSLRFHMNNVISFGADGSRLHNFRMANDIFKCISLNEYVRTHLRFHWYLFPSVEWAVYQNWSRWWLGAEQETSHRVNHLYLSKLTHMYRIL